MNTTRTKIKKNMNQKEYMIDDEPVSVNELIRFAKELDEEYSRCSFCRTSEAAEILRDNGYRVTKL